MQIENLIGRSLACAVLLTGCAAPIAKPAPVASDVSAPEPTPDAKALRAELTAVVRAPGFLDTLPPAQRAKVISEPLEPGMVVVYMVDLHGAARIAQAEDLTASGVTRDALRAVVEWNLGVAFPVPPAFKCEPGSVGGITHDNYFESSRLLLTKQWTDLAAAKGHVVVAVPRNDTLFVSCNPTPANIEQLSTSIRNLWPRADHPVSPAVLSWNGSAWEELKPPH
jgi:hypothetical protein